MESPFASSKVHNLQLWHFSKPLQTTIQSSLDPVAIGHTAHLCNQQLKAHFVATWRTVSITNVMNINKFCSMLRTYIFKP